MHINTFFIPTHLTNPHTACMKWLCRIKDAIYLGPIQRNAKKCPRTRSHSPLIMQIYRLSQYLPKISND